jgi:hypothetical protein
MPKQADETPFPNLQRGVLDEREIQNAIDGIVEYLRRKGPGEWWQIPIFELPFQARIVLYVVARLRREGRIQLRQIRSASGLSFIYEGRALAGECEGGESGC